ncbi:MAG: HAD hydrolase-like protein [Kiritimatiellae bacterium]|nr:HAD hydrolase-like protein [Kiritimatiellia bacterium]
MKNALFDLDGTLVHTLPDLTRALNLTRGEYGLAPITEQDVRLCIGNGVRRLVERAIPELPDSIDALLERQLFHYAAHSLDASVPYPGIPDLLRRLRDAGWKTAVVTNKAAAATRQLLDGLGISPLLDAIVGGGETTALKPDPEPLLLAAQRMGVTLDESDWMIGDHYTDLRAARLCGIQGCFCTYGYGQARGEPYACAIRSVAELDTLLLG